MQNWYRSPDYLIFENVFPHDDRAVNQSKGRPPKPRLSCRVDFDGGGQRKYVALSLPTAFANLLHELPSRSPYMGGHFVPEMTTHIRVLGQVAKSVYMGSFWGLA